MDDMNTGLVLYVLVITIMQFRMADIDVLNYHQDKNYFNDLNLLKELDNRTEVTYAKKQLDLNRN